MHVLFGTSWFLCWDQSQMMYIKEHALSTARKKHGNVEKIPRQKEKKYRYLLHLSKPLSFCKSRLKPNPGVFSLCCVISIFKTSTRYKLTLCTQKHWATYTLPLQELLGHGNPWPSSSRHTVFVLILMPEEVCNSIVIESAERWTLLQILLLSTWWSCTVTFHCLPFHCWVAVEFLWFLNFAIIPLTAACGISRGKRYHKPACFSIGLLSNLMSSLGQPILSQFD